MSAQTESESEVSFKIDVPDEHLSILQQKLAWQIYLKKLKMLGGTMVHLLQISAVWSLVGKRAMIEGLTTPVLRGHRSRRARKTQKGEVVDAIPLLFVHGCELNIIGMYSLLILTLCRAWKFH